MGGANNRGQPSQARALVHADEYHTQQRGASCSAAEGEDPTCRNSSNKLQTCDWPVVVGCGGPRGEVNAAAKTRIKPFICDVPAKMLKRSTDLSKGARMLHGTMRGLANGKTGELAIRGNPLDWKFIAREAEIGRDQWQRLLRELIASGYVTRMRERVEHYKHGRKRIVLGRARYFVHKQPKPVKKPSILLMPDSPTVEESGTQISSETPYRNGAFAVGVARERKKLEEAPKSSSPASDDDGSRVTSSDSRANPFCSEEDETLIRNVQGRLRVQYPQAYDRNKNLVDDSLFIQEAISLIDERGESAISVPKAYFASGIAKILDCEKDLLILSDLVTRKARLRRKFNADFTPTLNATQEQARGRFNRMVEGKIQ